MKKIIKQIIIKEYREFTEDVQVADDLVTFEAVIVAKEVEAVVQVDDGTTFSLGFSILRDSDAFSFESPRRIVQHFLMKNFLFDVQA